MESITSLGFLNIGTGELIFIVLVAVLVFGPDKLPSLAKNVGKGMREINRAKDEVKETIDNEIKNAGADFSKAKDDIKSQTDDIQNTVNQVGSVVNKKK